MSNYTDVKYVEDEDGNTVGVSYTNGNRLGSAPVGHRYYQEIMDLVEAGELTIEPADPTPEGT